MREACLLILVRVSLCLQDCLDPSLHQSLARRSCLLIHHRTDHLASKGIFLERLRFSRTLSLTQPSTAQDLLQRLHACLLIELGHLAEPLEGQPFAHHCPGHQQCPC